MFTGSKWHWKAVDPGYKGTAPSPSNSPAEGLQAGGKVSFYNNNIENMMFYSVVKILTIFCAQEHAWGREGKILDGTCS